MVPGPTTLPPEVVAAGARPILYSRSAEFVAIWEDVIERLRGVFQTEGEVLVFGASGSGVGPFSRFTCPSTGPLLQSSLNAARTAASS